MAPPPADYHQQAQANLQGARSTEQTEPVGPSNLYYNRQNHKQTHTSSATVQTKQDMILLLGSQDVRYINAVLTSQEAKERENTALVVLKSGPLMGEDTGIKMLAKEPIQEEQEGEEESEESSEDEPDFMELNEATQKATKEVRLEDNPPDLLEQDDDEYQFVNRSSSPIFKRKTDKAINPADPYDLWKDLAQAKATISFG